MLIYVNNEQKETDDNTTVETLMTELGLANRPGVAIAINDKITPRANWYKQTLNADDHIIIVHATQGG